jgi:signal transduction histidine kinase
MNAPLDDVRLRRLMQAGPWLLGELDLNSLLDRVLSTARDVTGARYAALGVLDERRRELKEFLTQGLSDDEEKAIGARPRGRGILGLLITEPHALRIPDLGTDPHSYGFPGGHPPMSNFLGVPITIAGEAWGNLYLTDKPDGGFDESDQEAATILAAWTAIAIERTRLLSEAQRRQGELEHAVRSLEATRTIAVAIGAETDLSRVLELIAKRGRAIVEADSVVIMLQDGSELAVAAGAGHAHPPNGTRIPIAGSTSGEVMVSQQPRLVGDVESLRVAPQSFGVATAQSALITPLVYRGTALGIIAAFNRAEQKEFSLNDEQVLGSFAASAATAVTIAQSVQVDRLRHTLNAAESERRRWARELHDETLQGLGALKLIASAASRGSDQVATGAALEQLVNGLESEIENLHAIISELRPAALDDLGLKPAIEALARRHQQVNGIDVVCRLALPDPARAERRLTPEVETTIYRLTQEALTNVAKHAGAEHATVAIETRDGRVRLRVEDDGTGFDSAAATEGFGLIGMRERAALLKGSVEISSGATSGTTVTAELPARYVNESAGSDR